MKNATTVKFRGTSDDAAWIRLFRFSLTRAADVWFRSIQEFTTWENLAKMFLNKYFPLSRINALKQEIFQFKMDRSENLNRS